MEFFFRTLYVLWVCIVSAFFLLFLMVIVFEYAWKASTISLFTALFFFVILVSCVAYVDESIPFSALPRYFTSGFTFSALLLYFSMIFVWLIQYFGAAIIFIKNKKRTLAEIKEKSKSFTLSKQEAICFRDKKDYFWASDIAKFSEINSTSFFSFLRQRIKDHDLGIKKI
jgi:hypothetical protein